MKNISCLVAEDRVGLEAAWPVVSRSTFGRGKSCSRDGAVGYPTVEDRLLAGKEATAGFAATVDGRGAVWMNGAVEGRRRIVIHHDFKGGRDVVVLTIGDRYVDRLSNIVHRNSLRTGLSAFAIHLCWKHRILTLRPVFEQEVMYGEQQH